MNPACKSLPTVPAGSEAQNWKIPGQFHLLNFTADGNLHLPANVHRVAFSYASIHPLLPWNVSL